MRVLLVEDAEPIRKSVARALRANGYAVDEASDGADGLFHATEYDYDVIILDIMLPKLDGREVLKKMRATENHTPVLMLTALDSIDDRVNGLRLGADDYLVKSFAIEELLARVEALTRRHYQQSQPLIKVCDIELNRANKTVFRAGIELNLTPQSFRLLELLMLRVDQVVTRNEIEEKIYDELNSPLSNVVESAMYALRKAITPKPDMPQLIKTRRGLGYVMQSNTL
ncbi:response regulator transcription factor [Catenovulum adriaticum]|uniref:Response regulator transcription factor n=1 Tax=Catenovulum adriaticum TaxID=2984846 RepID=A0ABY7ASH0_9ALTE|nr:response regulator transcription factor [Catenovulum sp. TS8]WAJ71216.1 response regulator transcription factor [Catenovulum sp. TS8]